MIGIRQPTALAAIQHDGLTAQVVRRPDGQPAGMVLQQVPAPGVALQRGASMQVTVSAGPAAVTVPSIVGLQENGAIRLLETVLLQAQPTVVASNRPAGTVLSQTPPGGMQVSKSSAVKFTVSRGPQLISVPPLRGLPEVRAVGRLHTAGLKAKIHLVKSAETAGTVVAQSPSAQLKVKRGTLVTVNISKGLGLVKVPGLRTLPVTKAVALIKAAGLIPIVVTVPSSEPAGTVIAQSPPRQAKVKPHTTVRINVSKGRPKAQNPPPPTAPPSSTAPASSPPPPPSH